jgi:hypothetical protein
MNLIDVLERGLDRILLGSSSFEQAAGTLGAGRRAGDAACLTDSDDTTLAAVKTAATSFSSRCH